MSENLKDNGPEAIQPVAGRHESGMYDPPTDSGRAPRMARSVSSDPEEPVAPAMRPAPHRGGTPRARRMSLSLTRVDAWSVTKVTFMLSIAGAIIQVVAAALVWVLLDVVGVFGQITQIVSSTGLDPDGFDLNNLLSITTVVSAVTIFSIIEVVLFTLLATIIALIYNVVSSLVGGIHVTLGDD
jgi:hypothetical protein